MAVDLQPLDVHWRDGGRHDPFHAPVYLAVEEISLIGRLRGEFSTKTVEDWRAAMLEKGWSCAAGEIKTYEALSSGLSGVSIDHTFPHSVQR
jgi:hypothetical protein